MKTSRIILLLMVPVLVLSACGEKKKSKDIITQRVVKVTPMEPVRMQDYDDSREVEWVGKQYVVAVHRESCDSLPMVKDESGQQFVDNVFLLTVKRQNGSVFFKRKLTKSSLTSCLDDDYRKTGIFEGLVFDRADGDWLVFGASVGHPQTDEYIPLVIRLSRMGKLVIKRDTELDTVPEDAPKPADDEDSDDGV